MKDPIFKLKKELVISTNFNDKNKQFII